MWSNCISIFILSSKHMSAEIYVCLSFEIVINVTMKKINQYNLTAEKTKKSKFCFANESVAGRKKRRKRNKTSKENELLEEF